MFATLVAIAVVTSRLVGSPDAPQYEGPNGSACHSHRGSSSSSRHLSPDRPRGGGFRTKYSSSLPTSFLGYGRSPSLPPGPPSAPQGGFLTHRGNFPGIGSSSQHRKECSSLLGLGGSLDAHALRWRPQPEGPPMVHHHGDSQPFFGRRAFRQPAVLGRLFTAIAWLPRRRELPFVKRKRMKVPGPDE